MAVPLALVALAFRVFDLPLRKTLNSTTNVNTALTKPKQNISATCDHQEARSIVVLLWTDKDFMPV